MSEEEKEKSVKMLPAMLTLVVAAGLIIYYFYPPGPVEPERFVSAFEGGWYGQEQDGNRVWRWADDRAAIGLELNGEPETRILEGRIRGAFEQKVKLVFNGDEVRELSLADNRFQGLLLALPLKTGRNQLEFISDGEAVTRGADTRELAFVLENYVWKEQVSAEDAAVVDFAAGWYPRERANGRSWSWSGGKGELDLQHFGVRASDLVLSFEMSSVAPRVVEVFYDDVLVSTVTFDEVMSQIVEVPLRVGVGESRIRFTSTTPASTVEGDSRELAYCVFDPVLKLPESEE